MSFLKRATLILYLTWMAFPAFGQSKAMIGQVLDSLDNPVPYANVVAINQSTQKIGGFAVSNEEGRFRINLATGSTYLLRVSFVGFQPFEREISEWSSDEQIQVILAVDETTLDQVEVVTELPITMKGDTLTYKTDAFTSGNERKLKDVLEKLPGFEVDDNGEVKVQGKKVDKVMVDGKNFFDGDTKLATKNLPANAVDRVQVLKNFNEVSPIRGLDNNESLALNIELKDGKKNLVFGDLTAGGGPKERYLGHANAFYYAPKLNLNLIADVNNVGELAFTLQDYFRFSGGLSGLASRNGSRVEIGGDDLGIPMAQRNNARDLETKLGALNVNFTPSRKWRHAGFFIASSSNNLLGSNSQRTYLRSDENNQETLESVNRVENASGLMKYSLTFTPREETYAKYSFFGKIADIETRTGLNSDFGTFDQQIATRQTRRPYSLQQKGEWYHAPNERQVFSMEVNWESKYQDPLYDLTTNQRPFMGMLAVEDAETYRFLQNQEIRGNRIEGAFNYYHILNPTNHLNWTLGYNSTNQQLLGGVDLVEEDQNTELDEFRNDADFGIQDTYLGMTYKTKWKTLIISPTLNLHRYAWKDMQDDLSREQEKWLLLPSVYAKWAIKTNRSLTYRFDQSASFMDVQKLATGWVIQDYNSIFTGNRMLDNGLFSNHSLSYNHFDFFSAFNLFGNLNWQRKKDDLVTVTDFAGVNRLLTIQNIDPINETLNGDLTFDKRFNTFKLQTGGRWNSYQTNTLLDGETNENQSFTQSYNFKITTTVFKILEIDLGYTFDANKYQGRNVKNTFVTHSPKLEIDLDIFKGLKLNADYTYNAYLNKGANTHSDFEFLNAFLSYQGKSSPWEFRVSVWNILDTQAIRRDSFSDNLISTYSYWVQPRYGLLSVKYDL
ncbi:TonB-dependent receptor [Algoriphagus vanfongensis]|uniref:TonB-dependent receptor n=1 Tax=Algoriphagus vanfongensis TaxID=426371 RepID=UPI000A07880B|nr:carboxypeptidase-like regulatory domain-containing protein [Algoriphagus vanfongensis]